MQAKLFIFEVPKDSKGLKENILKIKPAGADRAALVTVWESRKSPGINSRKPARLISRGLFAICVDLPFPAILRPNLKRRDQ